MQFANTRLALFHMLAVLYATQGTAPAAPPQVVSIECDMIVLPRGLARALIPQFQDDATVDQAWEGLQPKIRSGEATLTAHLLSKCVAGEKVESSAAQEVRYPTAYSFAGSKTPQELTKENALQELKAWSPAVVESVESETRKVGPSLSADVRVSPDADWVTLSGSIDHVRLLRMSKFDLGALASGEQVTMERPVFHSEISHLNLQVRSGQRVLAAIHTLPGDQGLELFLLKATVGKAGDAP
jgi:hypothetical protein